MTTAELTAWYARERSGYESLTRKAIATVEEKILASDKVLGGLGQTAEKTNAMIGKGYRWFVLTHDAGLIQSAAAGFLDHIER